MKQPDLAAAFARVPLLRGASPENFSVTPLSGYTNDNFRLQSGTQDWVLRLPRAETGEHIDRAAEAYNMDLAADMGIAPRPAWRDACGYMLTPTLVGTCSAAARDLRGGPGPRAILEPLRRLHRSSAGFHGRVDLGQLLERYYALLEEPLREGYRQRLQAARESLALLDDRDIEYVPSHNDLVLENILLGDGRVWLIDWEFSAMASPYWDLATLCNNAGLDNARSIELLRLYCVGGESMEESLLFDYRNLLQLLTDCWMGALST
jgi:thiamine kinase